LQRFVGLHGGQQTRKALRQHGFARAWRPDKQQGWEK
jgi:hypothetical protein